MVFRGSVWRVALALAFSLVSLGGQTSDYWYVGAKVGWVNGSSACEDHATSCGNDTAGGSIFVGYPLNDWLALEGGYDYLGDITADYPALGNPNVSAHYKGEMQGLEFAAKPFWQVNDATTLFAKMGTLAWDMDVAGQEVGFEHNADDKGWSPLLGAGVEYAFSRNWSTLLEYLWVNSVGGNSTGRVDLNVVNLGVAYHFASEPVVVPPTPAPTPAVYKEPQWSFNGAPFASNSSLLTPELQQALQPAIQRLRANPQAYVIIRTHADSRGASEFNQQLSDLRASVVRDYMMAQGVAPAQMKAEGVGESQPIADNATEAGRYQNRRVELLSPEFDMATGLTEPRAEEQKQ